MDKRYIFTTVLLPLDKKVRKECSLIQFIIGRLCNTTK